jgi:hypothetical protein
MCDPVTLGAGIAASAAGSYLTQNSNLNTAAKQAAAENGVLSEGINQLNNIYAGTNAPAFQSAVNAVSNPTGLADAQAARTGTITGNMVKPDVNTIPLDPNAPPAVRAAYNSDLGSAFNFDTNAAKASGTLGGYGDEWFNSGLGEQAAARTIGAGNSIAEEDKSVIQPEQQLASIEAYKPPSIWGQILSGGGNLLGAYAGTHASPNGAQLPFGAGACSRRRRPRCLHCPRTAPDVCSQIDGERVSRPARCGGGEDRMGTIRPGKEAEGGGARKPARPTGRIYGGLGRQSAAGQAARVRRRPAA